MNDSSTELLTLSPHGSVDLDSDVQDSFKRLHKLADAQYQKTSTTWKKLWQFIRVTCIGIDNEFEKFVVEHEPNDCALISKYSEITRIDLSHNSKLSVDEVYLNTLHIEHPLINFMKNENNRSLDILQELKESPILVFLHGLGGQMSQFEPVMALLSQCLEIISLDLPGFGDSRHKFNKSHSRLTNISLEDQQNVSDSISKMSDNDFTSDNIANIIVEFLNQKVPNNKKIVLIGHSMGCHLGSRVLKKLPPSKVEGLILLSPPGFVDDIIDKEIPHKKKSISIFSSWLMKIPAVVNLFRIWDRLEGLSSKSVKRQIGDISANHPNSALYIKLRQFRWNIDIDTGVLLKYAKGFENCKFSDLVAGIKKFNDNPFDKRVYEKTLIVCGNKDGVTPLSLSAKINDTLTHVFQRKVSSLLEIKSAGHCLLLSKPEFISGNILSHIENRFPERLHLAPAWVLRVKADISGDKWGLKNELKWSKLDPISLNITRRNGTDTSPLLGMKTLREGDAKHSPLILENAFYGDKSLIDSHYRLPDGNLIAVVDISADLPPYNPESFHTIKYYKCATVSKFVPDPASIRKFIQLIDQILEPNDIDQPLIAVHCHYGFNRTGFLICCYLIEKLRWSVEEAIEGFRVAKPPGIKHRHFIDALYVRYESNI